MTDRCFLMESCPSWSKEHDWKSCNESTLIRGFESLALRHVATSCISLAATFFIKVTGALIPLRLLFRKGHAAPLLFACKRAHDAPACYQPFSGAQGFHLSSEMQKHLFRTQQR